MKYFIKFSIFILFFGCKSYLPIKSNFLVGKSKLLRINELKEWQNLDIEKDSVLGVSLNRTYKDLIKNKKGKPIITAVIDSYIDINHEDLKNQIWENQNEIANNNIDDDRNGYIDDFKGWNFLGNKNGNCTFRLNFDSSRKLRILLKKGVDTTNFKGNKKDSLDFNDIKNSLIKSKKSNNEKLEESNYYQLKYIEAFKSVKSFFNNNDYSLFQLDSVIKLNPSNITDELYYDLYFVRDFVKTNNNKAWIDLFQERVVGEKSTSLNPKYNENDLINDNETNLNDLNYGNNKVDFYSSKTWHSTMMSGMIAAERGNKIGIEGFGNQIKIMPLVVSAASGNNRDKDISNAIKYAVDNGAKVISMSFGKSSPIFPEWIRESLIYTKEKDVLVIVSAGNSSEDMDKAFSYPNDYIKFDDKEESINNLIIVGGSSHQLNENLPYEFSNYGKKNVDVFAPASDIWCLDPLRKYCFNDGTSFSAALTSGLASLIRSHYPKLTASQVKQIIMQSGISYDIEVIVPGTKDKKVRFSELSKSGKVLNVYNAMLLAKKVSKGKVKL